MADIPSTEVPRFTQFHSKAATMEVATEVATAIITADELSGEHSVNAAHPQSALHFFVAALKGEFNQDVVPANRDLLQWRGFNQSDWRAGT